MKYKNIVWDWNGTLLNDLEIGVTTLNDMLSRRALLPLTSEYYRECFGFPVIHFYEKVGFEICSEEFLEDGIPHVEMRLEWK